MGFGTGEFFLNLNTLFVFGSDYLCLLIHLFFAMCFSQTCTDTDKFVVCGTKYCNFPVETRGSCTLKWASTALDVPFLCTTNKVTGACEQCPAGWTAEGAFCVECPNFKSCDVLGAVVCNGACAAGFSPTCDPSGFVSCISCPYNQSLLSAQRRRLTRGGIIDTPEKCDAYFECDAGYYLSLDSSGQLTCQTCQVPEPSLTGWEFFSNGLTFGDAFSCIYRSKPAFTGTNEQGQFGNFSQSCPLFYTSERFMAPSQSDCVPCPFPPTFGGFFLIAGPCVTTGIPFWATSACLWKNRCWTATPMDTSRGSQCVPPCPFLGRQSTRMSLGSPCMPCRRAEKFGRQ